MNLWRWYRGRRLWLKILLPLVVAPVALALLYVAGRTLQYAAAEKDPGFYVPATANVVIRAKDLERHAARMRDSLAWQAIQRRVLRDPFVRPLLNGLLKGNGAPTLDDLEDERKIFAQRAPLILDLLGLDAVAALSARTKDQVPAFCGIVRLKWLYYLATPFARFVLPGESLAGETVLSADGVHVAFVGALALASNNKALLEEALRRKGQESAPERPIAGRVVFEGSPALLELRKTIQDSGALSFVKWETARSLTFSADLEDAALKLEAFCERAQPTVAAPPPLAVRAWAPASTTGLFLTSTGGRDLIAWVRELVRTGDPRDGLVQNARDALKMLDDGGLESALLPALDPGMAFVTGIEEREGRLYPAFAMILPSRDPKAALQAMNGIIRKVAGNMADARMESQPVEESTLYSWRWPESLQINDFLRPSYAALDGAFVLGNNASFVEALIRSSKQGGGFEDTSTFRKFRLRLKERGLPPDPALAGGMLFPPLLRQSFDGVIPHVAKQIVGATLVPAQHRAEMTHELRQSLGRPPTEPEIDRAYFEGEKRMLQAREDALRNTLHPLESLKWAAFDAAAAEKGISIRAVVEFN